MAKLRVELMPMLDNAIVRGDVSREDAYREVFAIGCGCPPDEIVDVTFGTHEGFPVVFAAWESWAMPKPEAVILNG